LHIKPTKSGRLFQLKGKADSAFCGDKETRLVFIDLFFTLVEFLSHGDPRWVEV